VENKSHFISMFKAKARYAAILFMLFVFTVMPAFAQVELEIPTDDIFEQTNTWMVALAGVVTIGPAIAIAIALIMFIADSILSALTKNRKR